MTSRGLTEEAGAELFKPQGRLSVPEIEMLRGLLALGAHRPVGPLFTSLEASFSPCAEKLSQSQELEVVRPVQVAWYWWL